MRAEHRHELKTNVLAEWLGNLPQWLRENLRMVIYVSVVTAAVLGAYFYHKYEKGVVSVRKQLRLTSLVDRLPRSKTQILYAQAQGMDISYMLIQLADSLGSAAYEFKDDQMAALALIKRGQALRTELHYRLETVDRRDVESAISGAKVSYTEALEKSSFNPSLRALAKFSLGLCEEELGDFKAAEQIYRDVVENPDFEPTVAAAAARQRLETMAEYQQKVVFKKASVTQQPPAIERALVETKMAQPASPNAEKVFGSPLKPADINLPSR